MLTRCERMVLAPTEVKDWLSLVVLRGSWLRRKTLKEGHEFVLWHLGKVRGLRLVYGELSEERRGERKLVR